MASGASAAGRPASGPAPDGELLQEKTAASISGKILGLTHHGFYLEYPRARNAHGVGLGAQASVLGHHAECAFGKARRLDAEDAVEAGAIVLPVQIEQLLFRDSHFSADGRADVESERAANERAGLDRRQRFDAAVYLAAGQKCHLERVHAEQQRRTLAQQAYCLHRAFLPTEHA